MPGLTTPPELRGALPALLAPLAGIDAIGLAVSGGADSLALLLLVAEWAKAVPGAPRVFVYTVDHALRPEAAAEAAFVVDMAIRFGLPARALRWEGGKPATGVQAAARAARYRLIGEAMRTDRVSMLLTAHHAEDQAETVLMRMAHGSGLGGLRGMEARSAVEGVPVFRPLLGVPRAVLRAIVAEAGLMPVADPSNADLHYERVRWRAALPGLAALGLDATRLGQLARRAGEADAALSSWADAQFALLVQFDPLGAARLSLSAVAVLPVAVRLKLLARVLDTVGGGQKPRALGQVERLAARLAEGRETLSVTTLGVGIRRNGDVLWFSRETGRQTDPVSALAPWGGIVWDRRFNIRNRSSGMLGIRMAREFSRPQAEQLLARRLHAPSAAIRSAPLITGADGVPIALGGYVLSDDVTVDLINRPTENSQS